MIVSGLQKASTVLLVLIYLSSFPNIDSYILRTHSLHQ